jgi:uncharacterized protein YcaQ
MLPQHSNGRDADVISAAQARAMLLHAQALADDVDGPAGAARVRSLIERLGYVQIDSINVLERAHHLTLFSRLSNYRHERLRTLHETRRSLFEHWTHDASLLPVEFFAAWKERGRRFVERHFNRSWLRERIGREPDRVVADVLDRIEREGPVQSRDFERAAGDRRSSAWWGWKPHKAALEYLWWRGDLAVAARVNFNKVYDLTSRVYPAHHALPAISSEAWVDWACRNAIARLGQATVSELRGFFGGVSLEEARAWCASAAARGEVVAVMVEAVDGAMPQRAFAVPEWRDRAKRAARAVSNLDDRLRFLSPFDPILRDRDRAERLFDFSYRFEAFTPAPKRVYGYYVLPILQRDRLIGRADLKHDRDAESLVVNGVWWEQGVRATKSLRRRFDDAAGRLAAFIGAKRCRMPPRRMRTAPASGGQPNSSRRPGSTTTNF